MRKDTLAGGVLGTILPHQPQHLCFHLFHVFGSLSLFKIKIPGCEDNLTDICHFISDQADSGDLAG